MLKSTQLGLLLVILTVSSGVLAVTTSTNGTGGGFWNTSSTWTGGVVPTSGSILVKPGDRLFVDGNFTVDTITFQFQSTGFNNISVLSGRTLNCMRMIMTPTQANGVATLNASGTLNINQGSAGRDLSISGNPLFNNLTITINVPSGGVLTMTDQLLFNSLSSSTDFNLNTVGQFQCKAFTADFDVPDCNFILDINGNFDFTTMNIDLQQDNSDADVHFGSSADVDGTGNVLFITRDINNSFTFQTDAGSSFNTTGIFAFNGTISSSSNALDVDIGGDFQALRFGTNLLGNSNTTTIDILSTGDLQTTQFAYQTTGGSTVGCNYSLTIASGGVFQTGQYYELSVPINGVYNYAISGNFTLAQDFRTTLRNNVSGQFTIGASGSMTCTAVSFSHLTNGDLTFNNNGALTCSGAFHALASTNDVLILNFNSSATNISGNYRQRNSGLNSSVTTHVFNTLTIRRLELDVLLAASNSNNVMNLNHANAILNLNAIDFMTGSGTLIGGTTNNSTVNYKGSTSGDSIINRVNIDYDNLTVSNTVGISLLNHLNSNAVNGDITVASGGQLTLTGNGRITAPSDFTNNFVIQDNASKDFTVNGNYSNTGTHGNAGSDFYFKGNFSNTGTFQQNAGDTVYFNAASGTQLITGTTTIRDLVASNNVTVSSGLLSISKSIQVTNSKVFNANGKTRLLSDATGTAIVRELTTGNSISGNIKVQRFLNEGVGWYMIGTSVTGATIAHWDSTIITAGFTGTDVPTGQSTVFTYSETGRSPSSYSTGYTSATNITNTLGSTVGFFVYITTSPSTVQVLGTLIQGNNIATPVLTHTVLGGAPVAENGWHLRSNPYASPVRWSLVTRTSIQGAGEGYVRRADDGGNYWAITADGIDTLFTGEAFWVQAATSGSPRVTFNENDKVIGVDNFNQRLEEKPEFTFPLKIELRYSGKPTYMDYSVLRFGSDSNSANYDDLYGEARKMSSSKGTYPNISSWSVGDSSDVYYNGLNPTDSSFTLPLRVWTYYPSATTYSYNIKFNGIDEWVKNGRCLIIEDTVANTSTKLDAVNDTYTWSMKANEPLPRLFLNHSMPLSFDGISDASCYGINDGSASVHAAGSSTHDFTWVNQSGDTVLSQFGITGTSSSNSLPAGKYTVWVSNNGSCGDMAVTFEISEPAPVIADFSSDFDTIYLNANSPVGFTNSSANATDFFWSFGDGNTSNQASPSHMYAAAGSYTVLMAAIQDDCSDTVEKTILVIDNVGVSESNDDLQSINVFKQYTETIVDLNFSTDTDVLIDMYDVMGRSLIRTLSLKDVRQRRLILDVPADARGINTIVVFDGVERKSFKLYY